MLIQLFIQWISEVLHFCQGLPIILVGCKKDLRYDQKTIEELHKTSQKPVTPEQVSLPREPESRSKPYCIFRLPLGLPVRSSSIGVVTDMYSDRARR